MEAIGLHVLNGISYGMLLLIIASGLSLILGVMGTLNLVHGSLYLVGAYIGLTLASYVGSFWLVAILSGLAVGLIGLVIQRVFLSRLHGLHNEQALLTLGLVFISGNLLLWIFGPSARTGTVPSWLAFSIHIGEYSFPVYRFAIMFVGLVIFAGLWWLQEKSRAGSIVRAGIDDKEMTMVLGINYALVSSAIFVLGTAVAGFAGFISAPWFAMRPNFAFQILMLALIAVVIGGVGKVQGTLLGAVIVGLIDSFSKPFVPKLSLFTPFIAFVIILIVKPSGLLGRKL